MGAGISKKSRFKAALKVFLVLALLPISTISVPAHAAVSCQTEFDNLSTALMSKYFIKSNNYSTSQIAKQEKLVSTYDSKLKTCFGQNKSDFPSYSSALCAPFRTIYLKPSVVMSISLLTSAASDYFNCSEGDSDASVSDSCDSYTTKSAKATNAIVKKALAKAGEVCTQLFASDSTEPEASPSPSPSPKKTTATPSPSPTKVTTSPSPSPSPTKTSESPSPKPSSTPSTPSNTTNQPSNNNNGSGKTEPSSTPAPVVLGNALTPSFSSATSLKDGFTIQVSNFDSAFTWNVSSSSGVASINGSGLITVSGLQPASTAGITVKTSRSGFNSGSSQYSAGSLGAALAPSFGTPVQTLDGLTVQVTNYDASYSWSVSTSSGSASISSSGLITVTGASSGSSITVTAKTAKSGYPNGESQVGGRSLTKGLIPTFGTPTSTNTGFTVPVTNYDSTFTWLAEVAGGQASVSSSGVLTVTGITGGVSTTVKVITSKSNFTSESSAVSGAGLGSGLTPSFGSATASNDGYSVQVTNYSADFTWKVTSSSGLASISISGLITLTGIGNNAQSTITITTTRSGWNQGSSTFTSGSIVLGGALVPVFGTVTQGTKSFTVSVSNYSASYTWSVTTTSGTASISSSGLVTVSGLTDGASATVTVKTTRTNYSSGSTSVTGFALGAALVPTFGGVTGLTQAYSVQVSNYSSLFTWSVTASAGSVSINNTGLITVSGIGYGAFSTVTVKTSRTSYLSGTSTVTGSSLGLSAGLKPILTSPVTSYSGFTTQVTNYDSNYSWSVSPSKGTATISSSGLVTVTNSAQGTSSTVTVTSSRPGYNSGSATATASTLSYSAALIPILGSLTSTVGGMTVQVSNYDSNYSWSVTSSAANSIASINSSGLVTVSNMGSGVSTTIQVQTSRTNYLAGSTSITGSSVTLGAALTPTFGTKTSQSGGFTIQVSNYDSNFSWTITTTAGSASINGTGLITVSGLNSGSSATVTAATSRTAYFSGSSSSSYNATLDNPVISSTFAKKDSISVSFNAVAGLTYSIELLSSAGTSLGVKCTSCTSPFLISGLSPSTTYSVSLTASNGVTTSKTTLSVTTYLSITLAPSFSSFTKSGRIATVSFTPTPGWVYRLQTITGGCTGKSALQSTSPITWSNPNWNNACNIAIYAEDPYGNVGASGLGTPTIIDNAIPSASLSSVSPSVIASSGNLIVSVTATDDVMISSVSIRLKNSAGTVILSKGATYQSGGDTSQIWATSFAIPAGNAPGTYTINVFVQDWQGKNGIVDVGTFEIQ